jgi:hypothetical protein
LEIDKNPLKKIYFIGGFWIMLLFIILCSVKIITDFHLKWYELPIVIATIPFIYSVIGAFILRTMGALSEENFISLMKLTFSFGINAIIHGNKEADATK